MFKVNIKITRTALLTSFVNFEHISHLFSSVFFFVNFEQVNVSWVVTTYFGSSRLRHTIKTLA